MSEPVVSSTGDHVVIVCSEAELSDATV